MRVLLVSLVSLAVSLSLAGCAGNSSPAAAPQTTAAAEPPVVSIDELEKRLADNPSDTFVFDANSEESYKEGHVPHAKWLAFDQVTEARLPKDKNAYLVFYCYNPLCGASHQAAETAVQLGYRNVHIYRGGIQGWRAAQKRTER